MPWICQEEESAKSGHRFCACRVREFVDSLIWGFDKKGGHFCEGKGKGDQDQGTITMSGAAAVLPVKKCPYSAVALHPVPYEFMMPLHYPRFSRSEYEKMPEWQLDRLLEEYGLPVSAMGSLAEKREYAIGAFLWADQFAK